MNLVKLEDHAEDECHCGDYRHQHKDSTGSCRLNDLGHHGAPSCYQFRLAFRKGERSALLFLKGEQA